MLLLVHMEGFSLFLIWCTTLFLRISWPTTLGRIYMVMWIWGCMCMCILQRQGILLIFVKINISRNYETHNRILTKILLQCTCPFFYNVISDSYTIIFTWKAHINKILSELPAICTLREKLWVIWICSNHSHKANTSAQYSLILMFCNKGKSFLKWAIMN